MPQEIRDKISRAQIERHRRNRGNEIAQPDRKRCTKCKRMKIVPDDYQMRKRTLKSGEVRLYPAGECRECSRKRSAEWREKYVLSLPPEQRRKVYRKWSRSRNQAKRRRYQRDYQALQRRQQGIPVRGSWKKYRNQSGPTVPRDPFVEWLLNSDEVKRIGFKELARRVGSNESRFRVIARGHYKKNGAVYSVKNVSLELIDRCLMATGSKTMIHDLYPDL